LKGKEENKIRKLLMKEEGRKQRNKSKEERNEGVGVSYLSDKSVNF
jgi:hypothetical protein